MSVKHRIDQNDPDETPLHTRVMEQGMEPTHRTAMLRTQEWKLIFNESDPPELYHINGGWFEPKNVVENKQYAYIRKTMEKRLQAEWTW